jgi:hypothetical protein
MSNNLANLMVGFGLDLSALQKDAPEAFRILNSQTLGMSAEMKRASREGAESFRLIDEALGIHVSRPLTRILTQEFPGLATALQSLLGGAVFGALATIGVEAVEKVIRGIEKAQKAQEEWKQATENTEKVIESVAETYERKIAEANGLSALTKGAMAGADEARKAFEQIGKAIDEENKKAEEAAALWTRIKGTIGDFFHQTFTSEGGLQVEELKGQLGTLKTEIDRAFALDALHGTHEAMAVFQRDLGMATQKLQEMQRQKALEEAQTVEVLDAMGNPTGTQQPGVSSISPEQLAVVQQMIDLLNRAMSLETDRTKLEQANAAAAVRAEREKAEAQIAALQSVMREGLKKLEPETDPIRKLDQEIEGLRTKAAADFEAIGKAAQQGIIGELDFGKASASLDLYEQKLDQLKIKLEADALAKQALELLNKPLPSGPFTAATAPTTSGFQLPAQPTPAVPTLGAGGTTASQLDAFSKDTAAQQALVKKAFEDAITPTQQYQLKVDELRLAFSQLPDGLKNSTQAQQAFNQAIAELGEQMTKAELHLQNMQKELEKLLSHSTEAGDGVRAFFLSLQIEAGQNGKFAFDLLNQGMKGFEDELTKAVFTGKTNWEDMFRSMAESAFKFMEQKEIAGLFQMISGTAPGQSIAGIFGIGQGQQGPAPALPPTAPGSLTGLGALVGGGATGTGPQLAAAATTLQTGSTTLITAATALQGAALSLQTSSATSGAGGGSGIIGDLTDSGALGLPGFASGTDDAPGGLAWVGEQGPELLNLPGGSSVTPAGSLRSSGGDSHYYDMRGAVVTDELMRKADFARAMQAARPQMIGEVMANVSELQKRTLQSR